MDKQYELTGILEPARESCAGVGHDIPLGIVTIVLAVIVAIITLAIF